jgi:predicted nucleic acid-binding protein
MTIVVDASVAAKWILQERGSDVAESILRAVEQNQVAMLAPEILTAEIANLLWKAVWRHGMSADEAIDRYAEFLQVCPPLVRDSELSGMALDMALRYRRSVYDCLYLALAQETPCDFVTADRKLYNAVKNRFPGVRMLEELA